MEILERKIGKRFVATIIMLLFYLTEFRLFYLVSLPDILVAGSTNKMLLSIYSLVVFVFFLFHYKTLSFGYFGKVILLIFLSVSLSTFLSMFEFGFSLSQVIWGIIPYFILFLYFPSKTLFVNRNNTEKFIVMGEICAFIMGALFIYQYFIYTGENSIFLKLKYMITERHLWNPSLGMRIRNVFDGFFRVFSLIIVDRIIKKNFRHCILDFISFVTIILSIYLIDMSRLYLVIVLISSIVIVFCHAKNKLSKSLFLIGFFSCIIAIIAVLQKLHSIFGSISENSGSWYARVEAIGHYLNIGFNHFLFGIGFGDVDALPDVSSYVRGIKGIYYPEDVGIIGLFALLGITGVILYIWILIKLYKCYVHSSHNRALLLGLLICMLLSSILSSYLDKSRILSFVITIVCFEINRNQRRSVYECDNID